MIALSIKQPWAWLIASGIKPIENRTWKTNVRGEFLIHAGKTFDWDGYSWMISNMPEVARKVANQFNISFEGNKFKISSDEMGGVVGMANIVDCVTSNDSPFFFGPYGFVVKDAKQLPFFECNGKLGFFNIEYKR